MNLPVSPAHLSPESWGSRNLARSAGWTGSCAAGRPRTPARHRQAPAGAVGLSAGLCQRAWAGGGFLTQAALDGAPLLAAMQLSLHRSAAQAQRYYADVEIADNPTADLLSYCLRLLITFDAVKVAHGGRLGSRPIDFIGFA